MMKLLVTGGCGFIGSNFIRDILTSSRFDGVINIDNLSYGSNTSNLKDVENDKKYFFIRGDITDYNLVYKLVSEVDIVINMAAGSHVDRSISDPWSFYKSNTEGVLTILEAIRKLKKNVRMVQVGTDEVYSDIVKGSYSEEDRLKPSSPYSASKASADLFCLAYHRTYNLDVVLTRCVNNFGYFQFPEKLIPKTIIRAHMGLKVPVYSKGEHVRDWMFVKDHCDALKLVLEKGKAGEIYNISTDNELDNLTVIKKVLEIMGKSKDIIEFVEDRPGHDIRYSLKSSKIRKELGWKPNYSFDSALENTVKWYLSNEWWWKPLADERTLSPTPWKIKW
jgi:dTDP-glucose 4,6-dehydratase